ncbi:DUF881 domain-containing protein [Aeromicrobium endophyticum]|uniref:DUF881 domain-containing protein n=1 Tax=Aeromicrobium endophyticum TaxID=2292704 RepID=A0A371P299_9ACTN|nr:DUF881 domain-containing protein [Aeromicrobium endophyticum]REK70072.1 DUF881 domain-containing protein [Aeromicrobium endophyticum]
MRDEEGLLEKIADTALDDDYYVVRSGPHDASHRFNTVLTALVLAAFAVLVAMAAIQTRSERPAAERARETIIGDIESRKSLLADREARAEKLRGEVASLRSSVVGADAELDELRLLAADRAVRGPGLKVVTSPGPADDIDDRDLQRLVNGFWYAGAEAVEVNGKRIGSLTAIRQASGVIKVNFDAIGPPYTIVVLGDPDSLQERFEQSAVGRDWLQRRKRAAVQFDVTRSDDLSVTAVPKDRLAIRHATATKEDS